MTIEKTNNLFDIDIINAKTLIITPKVPIYRKYGDTYHLKEVIFQNDFSIKCGDRIEVNYTNNLLDKVYTSYFNSNFIYKEDDIKIRINEFEANTSSSYILPMININKDYLLTRSSFINCYIQHYDYKHDIGDYLYLMYRYIPVNFYARFVELISKKDDFLNHVKDKKDPRFDCFIFKLDEKYKKDINYIMNGNYSKIQESTKKLILNFHNITNEDNSIYQILYKGHLRRNELEEYFGCKMPEDIDYAEKPKMEEEIWNLNGN
jgi:hypothetical protein